MSRDQGPGPQQRPVAPHELMALRDGALSSKEEADLYERVANDPAAAALLEDIDATDLILKRVRDESMPADVSARIERALSDEAERTRASDVDPDDEQNPPRGI